MPFLAGELSKISFRDLKLRVEIRSSNILKLVTTEETESERSRLLTYIITGVTQNESYLLCDKVTKSLDPRRILMNP